MAEQINVNEFKPGITFVHNGEGGREIGREGKEKEGQEEEEEDDDDEE